MAFGITPTGFNKKDYNTIVVEMETLFKSIFGNELNTTPTSAVGVMIRIFADQVAEEWEVLEQQYNALNINTATGRDLDILADLFSLIRLPATKAVADVTFTASADTTIPIGTIVSVTGAPNQRFQTTSAITIVFNTNATGVAPVEAFTEGPISVAPGALAVLESTVSNVTAVTNLLDIDDGRLLETDLEFRQRIQVSKSAQGSSTLTSIATAIAAIASVESVVVREGTVNPVNSIGIPLCYIEALVEGADDTATENAVAQAIYENTAGGVGKYSDSGDSGTAVDALTGDSFVIPFTKPTNILLDFEVDLTTSTAFGTDADVLAAITAHLAALPIGSDLIMSKVLCVIADLPGVEDVVSLRWSLATLGTYSSANKTSALRDRLVSAALVVL